MRVHVGHKIVASSPLHFSLAERAATKALRGLSNFLTKRGEEGVMETQHPRNFALLCSPAKDL
jgi:hypothetical protein